MMVEVIIYIDRGNLLFTAKQRVLINPDKKSCI